ncbi:MAG: hypothetical protein AAFY81_03120 [Pseudomonadota bacterium]
MIKPLFRLALAALALLAAPLHAQHTEGDKQGVDPRAKASVDLLFEWLTVDKPDPQAKVIKQSVVAYRDGPEGAECLGVVETRPPDQGASLRVFFEDECLDIARGVREEPGKANWTRFVILQRFSASIIGHEDSLHLPKSEGAEWSQINTRFIPLGDGEHRCVEFTKSSSAPAKVQSGAAPFCSMLPVIAQEDLAPHAKHTRDVTFQVENVLSPLP